MNPCSCGHFGDAVHPCSCSPSQINRYLARVSGPLLDRIDIQVEVPRLPQADLLATAAGESSAVIRERVCAARSIQRARFAATGERRAVSSERRVYSNGAMAPREIRKHCRVNEEARDLLRAAIQQLGWYCRAASLFNERQRGVSMLPRMAALLTRQERRELAFDHLLLAWALAARTPSRVMLAEECRQQVEAFLQRQTETGTAPATPEAPPGPEPLLGRCRAAWVEGQRGP